MIGIETDRPVEEVMEGCRSKGVLVLRAKNRVRLLPPLNISFEDLKEAIDTILTVVTGEEA